MERLPLPIQLPSLGISLGEAGSEVFHTDTPPRNIWSSLCDAGVWTHVEYNLVMVIGPPLLLVMSMASSLLFGLVNAPSNTDTQIGSDGAACGTGVSVKVGDEVKVKVGVGVLVGEGVKVRVGIFVGASVLVGGRVLVGVRVNVGPGEKVALGSTSSVLVAGTVEDGVNVRDGVRVNVGVKVTWL